MRTEEQVDDVDVLVVAFTGDDAPGLVHALAEVVSDHGGNWESSHMVSRHGVFAGTLVVAADTARSEALAEDLQALDGMLDVTVHRTAHTDAPTPMPVYRLTVVGGDHPGIVEDVAAAIARPRVNVRSLDSERVTTPTGPEFRVRAELEIGADVDLAAWTSELDTLADRLSVDIDLTPADA